MRHGFKNVNGINLHYVTAGEGGLVVLLHGFPEFWYGWKHQIPALAKQYKVVAVDMRGYNESDKPEGVKNYASQVIAKDIEQLIYSFNASKAHVIGHDWGGGIAWTLAQRFPQCIDKLIVLNCPLPQVLLKNFFTNFRQLKKSWYMFFFQLPALPEKYIGKDLRTFFSRGLRGWARNKNAFTQEDIEEYVKAFQKQGALTAAVNYYRAAFRGGMQGENRKMIPVEADTLVIWGEEDKALGKELTFGMEKYFRNYFEIKYISNCSHWVQHEYPELVNRYILDFLRSKTDESSA